MLSSFAWERAAFLVYFFLPFWGPFPCCFGLASGSSALPGMLAAAPTSPKAPRSANLFLNLCGWMHDFSVHAWVYARVYMYLCVRACHKHEHAFLRTCDWSQLLWRFPFWYRLYTWTWYSSLFVTSFSTVNPTSLTGPFLSAGKGVLRYSVPK
jgi:hypothetical protein